MEIIFIPGLGESEKSFAYLQKHLSDIGPITTLNYDAFDSIEKMVHFIAEKLSSHAALIGHSLGGYLAQLVATQKSPKKLILMNTWANNTENLLAQNAEVAKAVQAHGLEVVLQHQIPLLMHPERSQDIALIDQTFQILMEKSEETYLRHFLALSCAKDIDSLSKITSPTLIIHGRQDPLFSLDQHLFIRDNIPNSKLAIIEDCGHNSPTEQPIATTALIRLFLT